MNDTNVDKMRSRREVTEGPLQTNGVGLMKGRKDGGGGREEGHDRGRDAICLDLKGRAMGVEEDT